jgi:hypothetical protein
LGLVFLGPLAKAQDEPRGRLYFLGVAYDESPPKGQTVEHYNYAPDNFARLFTQQSKTLFREIKVNTLKGGNATREAIAGKLRGLQRTAEKDDLVFVYWGTHGGTDQRGWGAGLPGGGHVLGAELKAELAKLPCPAIIAVSTCGSGGFLFSGPKRIDLPSNVVALCACRRKQSTGNELDISLTEALAGFGDRDNDGQVTLREAFGYVPMRYPKLTRDYDDPELQPVLGHGSGDLLDLPLTKTNDSHVAVEHGGKWYGATILGREGENYRVRYLGYDSENAQGMFAFADEVVTPVRVDLPGGTPPVEVEWNGQWYPAKILMPGPTGPRIHYVGYPASDDEVVTRDRVRFPFLEREGMARQSMARQGNGEAPAKRPAGGRPGAGARPPGPRKK